VSLYYLASYLFFTMHSTVCTVIDLFMCVCHILLINYYYYIRLRQNRLAGTCHGRRAKCLELRS